ncbi:uncharacterized protein LOC135108590 [Scylla paramamosain]|uniref:uncharacterized protein LOC135108590 n=1 Tax=Scylla paramamosain TaxID=85552 RepID=UPI003082ECFA
MKRMADFLLLTLAVALQGATASPLFISALKEDTLWTAKEILHLLLAESPFDSCSVILITDGATDPLFVQQVYGLVSHGGTLFEVEDARGDTNLTRLFIYQAVAKARWLRLLASYVTVVVVSDNFAFLAAFAEASDNSRLMVWETRLLVVTRLDMTRIQTMLQDYWIFSMMNTMFLQLKNKSMWQIFVHLPYSSSGAQVVQVATWKPGHRMVYFKNRVFFPDKYTNFHSMQVNLTWLPLTPYFTEVKQQGPDGKQISTYRGREYLIITAMGDALNFSPNPLPFEGWEVVLRRLRDREAFIWPVNLPILPDMVEEYDFSFFLERSTLAFTMAKPTLKPSWLSLYYPLQTEVWIFVAASVLILFIILLMIKHNVEGKRYETWLAVKLVIGTLLDEAIPGELPRKTPMRMLLTAWLIFTFIVGTVYRSNLTACLTIPTYPPRPETLVDLLNTGARVTIVDTMDIFVTSFKQSESTTLRTLTERMVYVPSFKEGMTESLTEKQVTFSFYN